jgi:hypothetical protein
MGSLRESVISACRPPVKSITIRGGPADPGRHKI